MLPLRKTSDHSGLNQPGSTSLHCHASYVLVIKRYHSSIIKQCYQCLFQLPFLNIRISSYFISKVKA